MQTTIFAGCRGNCEQGRRECTEDGGCFILPAEAATEFCHPDDGDVFAPARGMLNSGGFGLLAWAIVIVAVAAVFA